MRIRERAGLVVALTATLVLALSGAAPAQTEQDKARVDDEIDSLREQVQEASQEEAHLLGLIDDSSRRLGELEDRVASFDGQITAVMGDLDDAEQQLQAVEGEQRRTQARLDEASAHLGSAKRALSAQAIAAYTGQSDAARYAGVLLGSESMDQLVTRQSYLKAVVGSQADLISDHERLRDEVDDLRRDLERSQAAAKAQRDVVVIERDRLQQAREAQEDLRGQAAGELAQQEGLRAEVLARKEEFQAEIALLEEESAAIAETLRQRAAERASGASTLAELPASTGVLRHPVPGAPVTSPYGTRVHPIYGDARLHTGIDFGASTGTAILAAGDGVVASAGSLGGYGNATVIEHGGGMATLYGHQSQMLVSSGERVSAGEVIGRVGCTGACTGPHLHFEVRIDGDPVDPSGYL